MSRYSWALPASPDSKLYREVLMDIDLLQESKNIEQQKKGLALFRAIAEMDYWFFSKYVTSLGDYRISDPGHKRLGKLWVDEPFIFDRCREIQEDIDKRISWKWYKWFRYGFKTQLAVRGACLWTLCRDPQETIAIFTHKVEQVGESVGSALQADIRGCEELARHWPQFHGTLPECSDTRITVHRRPGPQSPSISVHPILGSATGGRYTRMYVDDAVVDTIARSQVLMKQVDEALGNIPYLSSDNTPIIFTGTVWGENDCLLLREKAGMFTGGVSTQPGILKNGEPQLRSKRFFNDLRLHGKRVAQGGAMDDYTFNAQILLLVTPRGDRYFRDGWKTYYEQTPEEMARKSAIHVIVDTGGGEEDSDWTVVRVLALKHDGKRANLDLWRERIGLTDLLDLLFGMDIPDYERPENNWKPVGGIVPRWLRQDPDLVVWIEDFANSAWYQAIMRELRQRDKSGKLAVNCTIRPLPKITSRSKQSRIRLLQPAYRARTILYPRNGFGHGSLDDNRDTMTQFFQDEYDLYTLAEDSLPNDDMLDTEAWPEQPEVKLLMPAPSPFDEFEGDHPWSKYAVSSEAGVSYAKASWRVS